ncbi:THAP domain-containing protein 2-like [Centruroides vittatus]|uniref:THAP domain-containing protein 2-like n=1 Tax=Centruroides vittatus TaxID=120091 RepID=UPI0035105702
MPHCVAFGCINSSEKGKIMKVFPRDPERRKLWAEKVNRDNWQPTNNSYLCEDHFDEKQWDKVHIYGKWKLKRDAIPTIFSQYHPPSLRKSATKRLRTSPDEPCGQVKRIQLEHQYAAQSEGINKCASGDGAEEQDFDSTEKCDSDHDSNVQSTSEVNKLDGVSFTCNIDCEFDLNRLEEIVSQLHKKNSISTKYHSINKETEM